MHWHLPHRHEELERMDTETLSPEATAEVLRALEMINRWLGGVRATLWHLKRFSRRWSAGQLIRMIDWGTGGADIPRAIVRWARPLGFHVEIVGVDSSAVSLEYAKKACQSYPEIQLRQADVTTL